MTAECSVAGGTEHFVARGTESIVAGVAEYFGGAFLIGSAYHHPSLHFLPHSYKWGNVVPMSTFLQPA